MNSNGADFAHELERAEAEESTANEFEGSVSSDFANAIIKKVRRYTKDRWMSKHHFGLTYGHIIAEAKKDGWSLGMMFNNDRVAGEYNALQFLRQNYTAEQLARVLTHLENDQDKEASEIIKGQA